MKSIVISVLAGAMLTLGACSHMPETAARHTGPVAGLTAEEIRTELAAISQQLNDLAMISREDLKRENDQRRMERSISRSSDSSVVGTSEPPILRQNPSSAKLQALQNRRNRLLVQLRALQPQS